MHPVVTLLAQAREERQLLLDKVLSEYPEIDFHLEPGFVAVLMTPRELELWQALNQNLEALERYAQSLGISVN